MNTKKCFKCGIIKPLTEYYKHKGMADGLLGKCKDCTKKDTKTRHELLMNDIKWVEEEKERHRKKYHRLGYKEKHKPTPDKKKALMDRYFNKYPEKKTAHSKSSKIKSKREHTHHWSYNKEHAKDVIHLYKEDHYLIHRYLKYDKCNQVYKTITGVLLDTKQKHANYLRLLNVTFEF